MRIAVAVVVAMVIGAGAGFGMTAYEFARVDEHFLREDSAAAETGKAEAMKPPRAEIVGGQEYDFGVLARNETREHVFRVRNTGDLTLSLGVQGLSCGRCVQTEFSSTGVLPHETAEIPVKFSTRKDLPRFSEYLELRTNDPDLPVIRFTITGDVTERVRLSKTELDLGSLSASQRSTTTFDLYGYQSDRLELLDYELANPDTASFFSVETEQLDVAQLDESPQPDTALRATLRIESGLPIGPIRQTIRLRVMGEEEMTLEIPVNGTVVSDISLVGGRDFRREDNTLKLGRVKAEEGTSATLRVLVKGPERENVTLSVESVDPAEMLEVSIGPRQTINDGAVHLYSLEIKIPPGVRRVNRLGHDQGKAGKVVLGTTHPHAKQIPLFVTFATE